MTSGAPNPKWIEQYMKNKKAREAKEKEEWDRLTPEEQEERLRQKAEELKTKSRLW